MRTIRLTIYHIIPLSYEVCIRPKGMSLDIVGSQIGSNILNFILNPYFEAKHSCYYFKHLPNETCLTSIGYWSELSLKIGPSLEELSSFTPFPDNLITIL